MSEQKKLTREEVENFIHQRISEIRDVCLAYNPRCHHVSMYYIGASINVFCSDDKTGEVYLQKHNGEFDPIEGDENV